MRQLMEIAGDARRVRHAVAKLGTNDKNRGLRAIAETYHLPINGEFLEG